MLFINRIKLHTSPLVTILRDSTTEVGPRNQSFIRRQKRKTTPHPHHKRFAPFCPLSFRPWQRTNCANDHYPHALFHAANMDAALPNRPNCCTIPRCVKDFRTEFTNQAAPRVSAAWGVLWRILSVFRPLLARSHPNLRREWSRTILVQNSCALAYRQLPWSPTVSLWSGLPVQPYKNYSNTSLHRRHAHRSFGVPTNNWIRHWKALHVSCSKIPRCGI